MGVDMIARRHNSAPFRQRFQGEVAEATVGGERTLLLKPTTYMNESGRAVGEAAHFHRIAPENIFVLHDELDLAPAKFRVKRGGGNAGHNGLRSISQQVSNDCWRLRMGIGHPGHKDRVHGYVLSEFAKAEEPWVETLCREIADGLPLLLKGEAERFQSDISAALQRAGFGEVPVLGGG